MAQPKPPQPRSKGYGKIWTKEEIERMMELELQFAQHPQAAKQMASHLPGKTAKQIPDKRREPSYRRLVSQSGNGYAPCSTSMTPQDLPDDSPHIPLNSAPVTFTPTTEDMTSPGDELPNPSTPTPSLDTQADNLNQTLLTVNEELDVNNRQLPMLPTHETVESTQPNDQTHYLIIADSHKAPRQGRKTGRSIGTYQLLH